VANKYVPSIDYTSRDYASILSDMTNLIPNIAPYWTNRDPADFGIALLELFAYMGDILNYYIDISANEALINTATQRDTVLQLADLVGYTPTNATASTVTLKFTNANTSTVNSVGVVNGVITIPAYTRVSTSAVANSTTTQIFFETTSALTLNPSTNSTVSAIQGYTTSDTLPSSSGAPYQFYALSTPSVINNSISVSVNGVPYQQVNYLIDYSGDAAVFSIKTDANNYTYIQFGDGISGRIPPTGSPIIATYRVGGGAVGNVAASTIKYITNFPGLSQIPVGLSVINDSTPATGGSDPESTDSIRINAPLSIRSINRAVSIADYANLAVQVTGVSKATASASVYSAVTLYVCPSGDPGVGADNYTPSPVFNNTVNNVNLYLVNKAPANTTVVYQPPTYVGVYIMISITVSPQYSQSSVITSVTNAINSLFYIDNVTFGDTIAVSDVYNAISNVEGVAYKNIQMMVRADSDQTYLITNVALTSNVATLTTSTTHNLTVGQTVLVNGVVGTGLTIFNGTYVVTSTPTSTTFTYALIAANVTSTAVSGAIAAALTVNNIVCAVNEIPTISELSAAGASLITSTSLSTFLSNIQSNTLNGMGTVFINASGGINS
jgi:Baseplate J-like protein